MKPAPKSWRGRWRLVAAVAWRFLRGRRSRLLTGTARAALVATVIGVTAMVVAMALMSGYRRDLRQKLIGGNAGVLVYPLTEEALEPGAGLLAALAEVEGVERVRRVGYGQGSLASRSLPDGADVALRGIDPGDGIDNLGSVELEPGLGLAAALSDPGLPGIVVGSELAQRLAAGGDEPLRLMVLGLAAGRPRFRFGSVRVVGTFESGFSEFDQHLAVLDRRLLARLAGTEIGGAVFELVVDDFDATAVAAERARELLGEDYLVRDWQELNAELFTALALQQVALFFVLGLIVLVSTFNVASSLVVLVRERMRDVGVLAALGMPPRHLQAAFLLYGGALSLFGALGGALLGSGAAWLLTRFELIRFDPEVAAIYFLSSVPFRIEGADLAAVVGFTLAVTLVACWLPARRAARVRPASALRYE